MTFSNIIKFQDLVDYNHNIMHMKLKTSSLDLNTLSVLIYLCFDFAGFTFCSTCLDAHGQKSKCFSILSKTLWMVQKHLVQVFCFNP